MGIMIWLKVMEALGRIPETERTRPLAIASCGNAALGAAVVARAAERTLQVFIPTDADPNVVERLKELGAHLNVCPRNPNVPGDPTYHAFLKAVEAGALPFTCQGNENGLTLEGGKTLGWEIVSATLRGAPLPDQLYIQVGGGALGSAIVQSLFEAKALGLIPRLPVINSVQTESCYPLARAHQQLMEEAGASAPRALDLLPHATIHRHQYMRPWETPRLHSARHPDDETYDWVEFLRRHAGHRRRARGGSPLTQAYERVHALTPIRWYFWGVGHRRHADRSRRPPGAARRRPLPHRQARGATPPKPTHDLARNFPLTA
jgi:threonine synthase